jgi:hypothetical protein
MMNRTSSGKPIPEAEFYNQECPFKPRKWNVYPRIYEGTCTHAVFPDWTREDHREAAVHHAERRTVAYRKWSRGLTQAARKYGDHGTLITGGFRDHWPPQARAAARKRAHAVSVAQAAVGLHAKAAKMGSWIRR